MNTRSDDDRNLFKSSQDIVAQAPTSEAKGEANTFEVIRSNANNPPCGEADCCVSDETRYFTLLVHLIDWN